MKSKAALYVAIIITILALLVLSLVKLMDDKDIKEQAPITRQQPELEPLRSPEPHLEVERVVSPVDKDGDGLNDLDDIVEGARKDAENRPEYIDEYYSGGYPPDDRGVCTDVVWRALKNAGYNFKDLIDADIRANRSLYPGVTSRPEPNIDFRRVKNQLTFFKRFARSLTLELKPGDAENLKEWQGGDIVTFNDPEHVGILSTKRTPDGIPYLIHNAGPCTREADDLMDWYHGITGHFRFPAY